MTLQNTGWKMMEQCVFIHLTDGNLTIQLPGYVNEVPDSIKAEIGDLVYNGPKLNDDLTASSPPGRFVYFTGSRASNDPPPGLGKVPWQ